MEFTLRLKLELVEWDINLQLLNQIRKSVIKKFGPSEKYQKMICLVY